MQCTKHSRTEERVRMIKLSQIGPNPWQPRRVFDRESLRELADSIGRYGILQPLTVRRSGTGWELVAGERRLRAARIAGLEEVPCLILDVDEEESGLLALVENLQRQDLDFAEQARGIERLIRRFGLSQEEAARRLGKSPSAVANKLRLLKLPEDVLEGLREAGLSERHGRALLRLPEDAQRREALGEMARKAMSVAQAEQYVDRILLREEEAAEGGPRTRFVLKDVRVFLNSLQHSVELMRQGGVAVGVQKKETEKELTVTVRIRR